MELENSLELLYGCFNQYAFALAKENIDDIRYYYETRAATSGNPLMESLCAAIKNYDLDAIGKPLFESILMKGGKTQAEANYILEKIIQYKQYTKAQIAPLKETIINIAASANISKYREMADTNPAEFIKKIKDLDFKTNNMDYLSTKSFGDLDINSIIADAHDDVIPSKFDFINQSYPGGGYSKGQLVIICMPPGQGKSLFLMEEILHMALSGRKCFYYAAGDINYRDFIIRMGAQFTGWSFRDVAAHLMEVYEGLKEALGNNLEICITPAGVVSARVLVDFVKAKGYYEVVGVDYDSNLKIEANDSMYDAFGQVYMTLSELTVDDKQNKLLFVAAQPKVNVWGEPVINLQDVGESSRKQHSADMIITRGREPNNPNHIAPMKIVKNRRGETDILAYSIRLNNGRTVVVPKQVYSDLKSVTEKRDFSENEINQMVNNFLSSRNNVSRDLQARGIGGAHPGGPTPF